MTASGLRISDLNQTLHIVPEHQKTTLSQSIRPHKALKFVRNYLL